MLNYWQNPRITKINIKNGKTPRFDNITGEIIKKLRGVEKETLLKIYNQVKKLEHNPSDWRKSSIVLIIEK